MYRRLLRVREAAEYAGIYVAPDGNDSNAGTRGSPLATIGAAIAAMPAGGRIWMRGGTYAIAAQIAISTKGGVAGVRAKLWAYPDETPVLDGNTMSADAYMMDLQADYWHIKGIRFYRGGGGGLSLQDADNNIIEGNDFDTCGHASDYEGKGLVVWGTSAGNQILNNDSHDNFNQGTGNGEDADGFQFSTTGTGNSATGNRAWNNSDDGFDLFNIEDDSTQAAWTLTGNWAYRNGYTSAGAATGGDGNGFKMGGIRGATSGTNGAHVLDQNVTWGNRVCGITSNQATNSQTWTRNTMWEPAASEAAMTYYNDNGLSPATTIRDNLMVHGVLGSYRGTAGTGNISNNYSRAEGYGAEIADLDASTAEGARGADYALPPSDFLKLVTGSALIGDATGGENIGANDNNTAGDYRSDVMAVLASFDAYPASTYRDAMNTLAASLAAASAAISTWDVLVVMAAPTLQAAFRNWPAPGGAYDLYTNGGTPDFTAGLGVDIGGLWEGKNDYNPTVGTNSFVQNDAAVLFSGFHAASDGTANPYQSDNVLIYPNDSGSINWAVNHGLAESVATATGAGSVVASRTGASAANLSKDGSTVDTSVAASVALVTGKVYMTQGAAFGFRAGLSAANANAVTTAFETYRAAVAPPA